MIYGTDERLCVDCRYGDTSSVFHRDMLDSPERELLTDAARPWVFDHDHGPTEFYHDEEAACAAQRAYRIRHGFDPMTGNAV